MGPIGRRQLHTNPLGLNRPPLGTEDGDIGASEPVDRLLRVSHDEELATVAVQGAQQVALARVGVLELVDQERPDLPLPISEHLRVRRDDVQRGRLQVVEVEGAQLSLGAVVGLGGSLVDSKEGRHDIARQPAIEVQVDAPLHQIREHRIVVLAQASDGILGRGGRPVVLASFQEEVIAQWRQVA